MTHDADQPATTRQHRSPEPTRRTSPRGLALALGLTWLAVVVAYAGALDGAFVAYDDPLYVIGNAVVQRGLSVDGIRWAFVDTAKASNWHPLTWLSHMLDVELYGLEPAGHHLTSVVLHAFVAALLAWLGARVTGSLAWGALGSLMFALHPLRVESVAWVAERKDVLSGVFLALTLLAWHAYVTAAPAPHGGAARWTPRRRWYAVALASAAAGLMAKATLVPLPLLLLLFDLWPLRRPAGPGLLVEKLPFVVLSAVVAVATLLAQRGAMSSTVALPLSVRVDNAVVSVVRYVGKTVWPSDLAGHYRYPLDGWPVAVVVGALAMIVAVTAAAAWWWRRRPGAADARAPAALWAWFCVGLGPVLGVVYVGHASMADRYTYVPHVLGALVVAVVGARTRAAPGRAARGALIVVALVVLAFAGLTARQVPRWRDTRAVFARVVAVDPRNGTGWAALAQALLQAGTVDEAEAAARRAVQIDIDEEQLAVDRMRPDARAHRVLLGQILAARGDHAGAIAQFVEALSCDAGDAASHGLLALSLLQTGDAAHGVNEARLALADAALPAELRAALTAALTTTDRLPNAPSSSR